MQSPCRALVRRALAVAAAAVFASTAALAGAASADHPVNEHPRACRMWAPHPHPFVKVAAQDDRFDTDCIEAPANRRFRIYLENHDRHEHNISIYTADPEKDDKAERIFEGQPVRGRGSRSGWPPHTDYAIDALSPGEYFFRDDNVRGMHGRIHVPEPEE